MAILKFMIAILTAAYLGLIGVWFGPANLIVAALVLVFPLVFIKPYEFFLVLISVLVLCPHAAYGIVDASKNFNLYYKGSGQLVMPFIDCFMIFLFIGTLAYWLPKGRKSNIAYKMSSLDTAFFVTSIVITIYILAAFFFNDTPGTTYSHFRTAVTLPGMIYCLHLCLAYWVTKLLLETPEKIRTVMRLILFLAASRAIWGIVRYIFLGGDPANFYANFERSHIKLTFFDMYDSVFFIFCSIYCLYKGVVKSVRPNLGMIVLAGLFMVNILLSYRRGAWLGLALVCCFLFSQASTKVRSIMMVCALIFLPIVTTMSALRFGDGGFTKGISTSAASTEDMGRFAELFFALRSGLNSPIVGLGSNGAYTAPTVFRWETSAGFCHSGPVYIFMKMGLLGLSLMLCIVGSLIACARSKIKVDGEIEIIYLAATAALIFIIPDFLFETTLIVFRHSVTIGILIGLISTRDRFKVNVAPQRIRGAKA